MNNITVNNYIETILNPKGKFKTIDIKATLNSENEPILFTNNGIVTFAVSIANTDYLLKCFTNNNIISYSRAKLIAQHTNLKQYKHLTTYQYLYREMLIFNSAGECDYVDVVLEEVPKGESLIKIICDLRNAGDYDSAKVVFRNLISMFKWMQDFGMTHSNITPKNIIIDNNLSPVLVNYDLAIKQKSNNDFYAISTLCTLYYTFFSSEKRTISTEDLHRNYKEISRRVVGVIANAQLDGGLAKLKELATHIIDSSSNLQDWNYIESILIDLSTHLKKEHSLEIALATMDVESKIVEVDISSQYDFIGTLSDALIRVERGGRWQFIDSKGDVAIVGPFDMAYDFIESRAAVSIGDKWGVISQNGEFVITPIYDDITWDGDANVIIASDGAFMGLINRSGKTIAPFVYDSIEVCSDGCLLAQRDYYYGYLKPDGTIAIEFKYDKASSFRNGVASVMIGEESSLIDTCGEQI